MTIGMSPLRIDQIQLFLIQNVNVDTKYNVIRVVFCILRASLVKGPTFCPFFRSFFVIYTPLEQPQKIV